LIQTSDLSAEAAVLGSVLLKPECLDDIAFLEPRDFASKRHELIYQVMRYLYDNDRPVDAVTILNHFRSHNRVEDLGGASYLVELSGATPTAENVRYYAEIVRSKAHRRRGVRLAQKIIEASEDDYEDDEAYFAAIDALVDEIRPQNDAEMVNVADSRERYFRYLTTNAGKLLTGMKSFDEWTGGIWRGWLYVLAGRPSAGKTAKAIQMATGVLNHNTDTGPVLIFSQEMNREKIIDRMISNVGGVNYNRLSRKGGDDGFNQTEMDRINQAYDKISRWPLYIRDTSGVTIDEIRATVRRFQKRYGKIGLVVVDYLQIMQIPQKRGETRDQAIGKVTRTAKHLARNMDFPFILLSQLNRESEKRGEPLMSDLRESGAIEQDADVIEFLWDTGEMERSAKIVESIFRKGRDIGTRKFRLALEWWWQRFVELEPKKEAADDGKRKANRK
jgi:replicative DNA helicase